MVFEQQVFNFLIKGLKASVINSELLVESRLNRLILKIQDKLESSL